MKILSIIASMGAGGAERVMTLLTEAWARKGHGVTLATLTSTHLDYFFVHSAVKRRALNLDRRPERPLGDRMMPLLRVARIRRLVEDESPDVVVSFIDTTNILTLLACVGKEVPVVVSERVDPRMIRPRPIDSALRILLYPRAAGLVVQTESVLEWTRSLPFATNAHVIPNPVFVSGGHTVPGAARAPYIAALGRLERQKGFDLLIEAYAKLVMGGEYRRLVIAGIGSERESLRQLAARLGVADRVEFPGHVNASEFLRGSELFVLSSRFEGFPNVLIEAMALGVPVVATECPSGPNEIVRDGVDGLLVRSEDSSALARGIAKLSSNPELRGRIGAAAAESAQRFSVERISERWIDLFTSLLRARRNSNMAGKARQSRKN